MSIKNLKLHEKTALIPGYGTFQSFVECNDSASKKLNEIAQKKFSSCKKREEDVYFDSEKSRVLKFFEAIPLGGTIILLVYYILFRKDPNKTQTETEKSPSKSGNNLPLPNDLRKSKRDSHSFNPVSETFNHDDKALEVKTDSSVSTIPENLQKNDTNDKKNSTNEIPLPSDTNLPQKRVTSEIPEQIKPVDLMMEEWMRERNYDNNYLIPLRDFNAIVHQSEEILRLSVVALKDENFLKHVQIEIPNGDRTALIEFIGRYYNSPFKFTETNHEYSILFFTLLDEQIKNSKGNLRSALTAFGVEINGTGVGNFGPHLLREILKKAKDGLDSWKIISSQLTQQTQPPPPQPHQQGEPISSKPKQQSQSNSPQPHQQAEPNSPLPLQQGEPNSSQPKQQSKLSSPKPHKRAKPISSQPKQQSEPSSPPEQQPSSRLSELWAWWQNK